MPSIIGFLPQIGPLELVIIVAIVLLIFGPKRIVRAFKSLGTGFRNFRHTVGKGDSDESDPAVAEKSEPREKSKTGS